MSALISRRRASTTTAGSSSSAVNLGLDPDRLPVFVFFNVPQIKLDTPTKLWASDITRILSTTGAKTIIISDTSKITYERSTYAEAGSLDYIKYKRYQAEVFDCEDFADVMLGEMRVLLSNSCFGRVDVETKDGAHALNFFIDPRENIWYFEPQTGEIFSAGSVTYKPRFFYV